MSLRRIIREPLAHFLALGALLFGLYALTDTNLPDASAEIVIDDFRVRELALRFERTWQRPPTAAELNGLIDSWVREEMLYREGLALGLDRDDPLLKRRIAQKVSFMQDQLSTVSPNEQALEEWLAANAADYRFEPTWSFRQLFFNPERHGDSIETIVEQARAAISRGADAATLGDGSLLPGEMTEVSTTEVRRTFGGEFAEALGGAAISRWTGPLASTYGVHLVRIDAATPARDATLAEVRAEVERDVAAAADREAEAAYHAILRERYPVRFADDVSIEGLALMPDAKQ